MKFKIELVQRYNYDMYENEYHYAIYAKAGLFQVWRFVGNAKTIEEALETKCRMLRDLKTFEAHQCA